MSAEDLTLRSALDALRKALPGHNVSISCELANTGEEVDARWSGAAFVRLGKRCANGSWPMVAHVHHVDTARQAVARLVSQACEGHCICSACADIRIAVAREAAAEVKP